MCDKCHQAAAFDGLTLIKVFKYREDWKLRELTLMLALTNLSPLERRMFVCLLALEQCAA
jgi:hypothetical protein